MWCVPAHWTGDAKSLQSTHLDKFGTWWRPISRQKYIFFSHALFLAFHLETVSQILPAPFTQFQSPLAFTTNLFEHVLIQKLERLVHPTWWSSLVWVGSHHAQNPPSTLYPFKIGHLALYGMMCMYFMLWSHSLCFPIHSKSLFRGYSLIPTYNAKGKKKKSSAADGAGACVRWLVLVVWRQQQW